MILVGPTQRVYEQVVGLAWGGAEPRSIEGRPTEIPGGHPPEGRVPVGVTPLCVVRRHPTAVSSTLSAWPQSGISWIANFLEKNRKSAKARDGFGFFLK